MTVARARLDIDINREFSQYQTADAERRTAKALDQVCRARVLGSDSSQRDCHPTDDELCSVVDPKTGKVDQVDKDTPMGDSLCLSVQGEGQTWEWGGKDAGKIIMRDGNHHYAGVGRADLGDYWSWARDRLGFSDKQTQDTVSRMSQTLGDLRNEILVLSIRAGNAGDGTAEEDRLKRDLAAKSKQYTAILKQAATQTPMVKSQIANELANLRNASFANGETDYAAELIKAAQAAGVNTESVVLRQVRRLAMAALCDPETRRLRKRPDPSEDDGVILEANLEDLSSADFNPTIFNIPYATKLKVVYKGAGSGTKKIKVTPLGIPGMQDTEMQIDYDKCFFAYASPPKFDEFKDGKVPVTGAIKDIRSGLDGLINKMKKMELIKSDEEVLAGALVVMTDANGDTAYYTPYLEELNTIFSDVSKWKGGKIEKGATLADNVMKDVYREEFYGNATPPQLAPDVVSLLSTEVPGQPPRLPEPPRAAQPPLEAGAAAGADDVVSLLSTEVPGQPPRIPGVRTSLAGDEASEFNVDDYYAQMYGQEELFDGASVSELPLTEIGTDVLRAA